MAIVGTFKRATIRPSFAVPPPDKMLSWAETQRLRWANAVLDILGYSWFGGRLSVEANRMLPAILLAIFSGELRGEKISKRDACAPLGIDPTKTGARYMDLAQEHGLISVEKSEDDRRRGALSLTDEARSLLSKDLDGVAEKVAEVLCAAGEREGAAGRGSISVLETQGQLGYGSSRGRDESDEARETLSEMIEHFKWWQRFGRYLQAEGERGRARELRSAWETIEKSGAIGKFLARDAARSGVVSARAFKEVFGAQTPELKGADHVRGREGGEVASDGLPTRRLPKTG